MEALVALKLVGAILGDVDDAGNAELVEEILVCCVAIRTNVEVIAHLGHGGLQDVLVHGRLLHLVHLVLLLHLLQLLAAGGGGVVG